MSEGWIKLHRKIQECSLWLEKPYDHARAWIDLLLLANHEDKKILFDGSIVTVGRGQRLTSIRKLADRWGWSRGKVVKFLDILEEEQMITRKSDKKKTLLTIENYGIYQDVEPQKSHRKATEKPLNDTNKNEKNDNKNISSKEDIYSDPATPQEVVDAYNRICVDLPAVRAMTEKRKSAIRSRLKKYTYEDLKEIFTIAQNNDFLKGHNSRGWKANFDFLINESNMAKVKEGFYEQYKKPEQDAHQAWLDKWRNA